MTKHDDELISIAVLFTNLAVLFAIFYGFIPEVFVHIGLTLFIWWIALKDKFTSRKRID